MKVYTVVWYTDNGDVDIDDKAFLTEVEATTYASIELTKVLNANVDDSTAYEIKEVEVL